MDVRSVVYFTIAMRARLAFSPLTRCLVISNRVINRGLWEKGRESRKKTSEISSVV